MFFFSPPYNSICFPTVVDQGVKNLLKGSWYIKLCWMTVILGREKVASKVLSPAIHLPYYPTSSCSLMWKQTLFWAIPTVYLKSVFFLCDLLLLIWPCLMDFCCANDNISYMHAYLLQSAVFHICDGSEGGTLPMVCILEVSGKNCGLKKKRSGECLCVREKTDKNSWAIDSVLQSW